MGLFSKLFKNPNKIYITNIDNIYIIYQKMKVKLMN